MPGKGYLFKVVVCGDTKVGKTSLILQYTEHKFSENYIYTIGSNFSVAEVLLPGNELIKLQLWDLAGQVQFSFVRPSFYRGAPVAILVYDVTRRETLKSLGNWKEEVAQCTGAATKYFVLGNKCDLEELREVSLAEGEDTAKKLQASGFWETSAKTGANLLVAFRTIAASFRLIHE
ncbi:MAG TPA: Rab family GTPase [Candidatus Lokiarchaeia archaeon]|nr:Rab family GTPase [Candidatus Lokiarchaeia archaeon]